MLVALRVNPPQRAEASKDLPGGDFRCPACGWPVILKRGRVKVAHFAHQPGSPPCSAGGESVTHMRAKALLAARFRELGYLVELEEPHRAHQRRVDVAVTLVDRHGGNLRIAVEVQDSAIAVDEIKRRTVADRAAGFFATVWVFTSNRLSGARAALPGRELRLPEEMRYLINRWRAPVAVLDVDRGQVLLVDTAAATREGETYYDHDGEEQWRAGRTLRATRQVTTTSAEFALVAVPDRYGTPQRPRWTAGFKPVPEPDKPWMIVVLSRDTGDVVALVESATPPNRAPYRDQLIAQFRSGRDVRFGHVTTGRTWELECKSIGGEEHFTWQLRP